MRPPILLVVNSPNRPNRGLMATFTRPLINKYGCNRQVSIRLCRHLVLTLKKIQYIVSIATALAFGSNKLSILFFYRRVFCDSRLTRTFFDMVTRGTIVLIVAWTIAFTFGFIFKCGAHPSYAWAPVAVVAEKCHVQTTLSEAYAVSDLILDVWIWSLPLPKVCSLIISKNRRGSKS